MDFLFLCMETVHGFLVLVHGFPVCVHVCLVVLLHGFLVFPLHGFLVTVFFYKTKAKTRQEIHAVSMTVLRTVSITAFHDSNHCSLIQLLTVSMTVFMAVSMPVFCALSNAIFRALGD